MPPLQKRCTLQDIADYCGLSRATVSQILNSRPGNYSSAATRQRVHDAAQELGYLRSYGYQMMHGEKIGTVVILVSQQRIYEAEYAQQIIMMLFRELSRCGKVGFLVLAKYTIEENVATIRDLIARGVEGLLAVGSPVGIKEIEAELRRNRIAFAGLGMWSRQVSLVQKNALEAVVRDFAATGFNNIRMFWRKSMIGNITMPETADFKYEQVEMPWWDKDHEPDFNTRITRIGYEITRQVMLEDPGVNGLFYQSDMMMLGGLRYLVEQNIAVGKSVRLCGMDDSTAVRYNAFPLSTLAFDHEFIVQSLLKIMDEERDQTVYAELMPVIR